MRWTPLAIDGADLPRGLQQPAIAVQRLTIGQTLDYAFTPSAPGVLKIVVRNGVAGPVVGDLTIEVLP
ncbi:MAG TPA: hypothetical protein VEV38_03580 [Candidatus Eremiobacteraceae bacterium]|nr:hypothetical protein [Candidatus Eremiobacteraceae bacterium]